MTLRCGRRTFLKASGAAAVGALMPLGAGAAESQGGGKIARVVISSSAEHAGKSADLPVELVSRLVSEAVMKLTSKAAGEAAWKSLFRLQDRVAIKVNTLAGPQLSTHPAVAAAVVSGIVSAGVAASRIIVFDRSERELTRAGFKIQSDPSGVRYLGTDSEGFGLGSEIITSGTVGSLWSRIVTDFATAIVNVPVMKDHDLSGVSLGMKNFFGVIHNPNKYHDNGCDPYVADLSVSPLIRDRLRLVLIDGLTAQADGGPAYSEDGAFPYAGLIAGTDPVATDRVGWAEIETIRAKLGRKPLQAAGRQPRHIMTAAGKGLGVADLERIDVVRTTV